MTEIDSKTYSVSFFNPDKKFGFAEARGERVFFHLSGCREVEGTPEKPRLTNRHAQREPLRRGGQRIVAKVVSGPKGLRAIAWGFVPTRTWLEELDFYNTLAAYAGGHVEIRYSERLRGQAYARSQGKLAATPQLTPGDVWWCLGLSYDAYDSPMAEYGDSTGRKDVAFLLAEAFKADARYGRYALDVYTDTKGWAHIVLYPPGQWIGD